MLSCGTCRSYMPGWLWGKGKGGGREGWREDQGGVGGGRRDSKVGGREEEQ